MHYSLLKTHSGT